MSFSRDSKVEWLVRSRRREILGPFTTRELLVEIEMQRVLPGDEIAKSADFWIFVQDINLDPDLEEHYRDPEVTPASSILDYYTALESKLIQSLPEKPRQPVVRPSKSNNPHAGLFAAVISGVLIIVYFLSFGLQFQTIKMESTARILASLDFMTRQGNKEGAYELLHSHRKLISTHPERWIPYSILLADKKQSFGKAKQYLSRELKNTGLQALNNHFWLGYIDLHLGEPGSAAVHFRKVLELKPDDGAAKFNLAVSQYKLTNYSRALNLFREQELIQQSDEMLKVYIGKTLEKLRRFPEARHQFLSAISLAPERWSSRASYAEFLFRNDEVAQARDVLKEMLTLDPGHETSFSQRFEYFNERFTMMNYLKLYEKVMGESRSADVQIGKMYLGFLMAPGSPSMEMKERARNGNLTAQVLWLKMLLDTSHSTADIVEDASQQLPEKLDEFGYYAYVLRGDAKARLGRVSEAKSDFEAALELAPKNAIGRLGYISLLGILNQKPLAQKELLQLLNDHPQYTPALKLSTAQNSKLSIQ